MNSESIEQHTRNNLVCVSFIQLNSLANKQTDIPKNP